MIKKIEIGDLVKWFEYYADGDIVRDGGTGIVLECLTTRNPLRIKVFCTKKRLAQWFSIREIELIKKGTYKPNKNIKKEI